MAWESGCEWPWALASACGRRSRSGRRRRRGQRRVLTLQCERVPVATGRGLRRLFLTEHRGLYRDRRDQHDDASDKQPAAKGLHHRVPPPQTTSERRDDLRRTTAVLYLQRPLPRSSPRPLASILHLEGARNDSPAAHLMPPISRATRLCQTGFMAGSWAMQPLFRPYWPKYHLIRSNLRDRPLHGSSRAIPFGSNDLHFVVRSQRSKLEQATQPAHPA